MNLFRALTGQYLAWNDTFGEVIETYQERLNTLDPIQKIAFINFINCSTLITHKLIHPDSGKDKMLAVDIKHIDIHQAEDIFLDIVGGVVSLFETINPHTSKAVRDGFYKLTGRNLIYQRAEPPKEDLVEIGSSLWSSVVNISGSDQDSSFIGSFQFTAMLGVASGTFFNAMGNELAEYARKTA